MDKEKLIAEAEQNAYKDMLLAMIDVCHPRSVHSKKGKITGNFRCLDRTYQNGKAMTRDELICTDKCVKKVRTNSTATSIESWLYVLH